MRGILNIYCIEAAGSRVSKGPFPLGERIGCGDGPLAAKRAVIPKIIIPEDNEKDLADVPEEIKNGLEVHHLKYVREVIDLLLERKPQPVDDKDIESELDEQGKNVIQGNTVGDFVQNESTISHN